MTFSLITSSFFINSAFVKQEIRVLASHVFEMIIFVFMFVLTETMKCLINRSEESADQVLGLFVSAAELQRASRQHRAEHDIHQLR